MQSKVSLVAQMTIPHLSFISSPPQSIFFLLLFNDSGHASWTYSCEYFRYPTIPRLTWIWREPLEPGVAPTTPDDWSTTRAKSLTRVNIFTSTQPVRLSGLRLLQAPSVCVYAGIWLIYYTFIHRNTWSVVKVSRFMCLCIHRVLVRLHTHVQDLYRRSRCFALLNTKRASPQKRTVFVCFFKNNQIQKHWRKLARVPDVIECHFKTASGQFT